ncbi:MAG: hypothetical protein SOX50_12550 [Terrisporobacter othiniensis]|uniref:hypothetical protein n=1 Tax=Terrisporobacter othiniensis TaxID=1577792 RepID=UPI002A766378|nr:hypothetical protein [Terrisporobacter othiniensis]MDY3374092.1 hypothetical protein [Terrisporobacter othiniensis]
MSYIERDVTLNIDGKTAKFDDMVYIFKGDRDIQLNIKIIDTKMKFSRTNISGNVLTPLPKGCYARVGLVKPKGGDPVIRDRVAIEDDKVKFLIDSTVCDELDEVGIHKIQIQIYALDDDASPRWTLPSAAELEVCKPDVDFDGITPIVGLAKAGLSMTISEGDTTIVDFNEDGTYNKTTWSSGDVISTEKLNKIENVLDHNVNKTREHDTQIKDIAKDVLLEDGKLYLKKSDGTKLGTGVILPISGSGGSVTWENLTGKPSTFTPSSHSHSKSDITDFPTIPTVSNDLTNALKANYDSAYTHSTSAHAPANAQKNSDITKEEIEAKLTGEISTHSHANGSSIKNEWVTLINKKISVESVNSILENFILDGNYNYFKIYITRTSNESNTVSSLSLKQIIINGINCGSFTINFGNPQTERKEIFVSVHKSNNLIDWSYRVATNSLEYNQSNMTYGLSRMGINSSYLNKLYVAFDNVYTGDINIIVEGGVV